MGVSSKASLQGDPGLSGPGNTCGRTPHAATATSIHRWLPSVEAQTHMGVSFAEMDGL